MRSIGVSRSTISAPPITPWSKPWTRWICPTFSAATTSDFTPPATARNSKCAGIHCVPARSFKYFGQGQGVSAYTFVDERHLLWHSLVISAAARESTYVVDGLMNNNDVVKSDIHSTDTHGYTEAVFALTHLLGIFFRSANQGH